jgi:C-terminal processing protease CtpA/Prc
MRLIITTLTLLVLSICSTALNAQSEPTLESAVRDQYVDAIDEQKLREIANSDSLLELDEYSHFLSKNELIDISNKRGAESFVIPLSKQVLYMRIPIFHAKTSSQIHRALEVALRQTYATYIVVDLRDNSGGLLNAAIEVADEFVSNGTLATTKGRIDTVNLVFLAKPNGLLESKKVAVLINKNTASAAELLAGILKFNANACILGQNSFGKSAVQTQIPLNNGGELSLTTAVYYFSNNQTVDRQGLKPDFSISAWQLWRNPPYTIDQAPNVEWLQNSLIEKSIKCMDMK